MTLDKHGSASAKQKKTDSKQTFSGVSSTQESRRTNATPNFQFAKSLDSFKTVN